MAFKSTLSALALTLQVASARFLNASRPATPSSIGSFSTGSLHQPHTSSFEVHHTHSSSVDSSASVVTITANSTYVPPHFHRFDTVDCSFYSSADEGDTCDSFSAEWGLTDDQFVALNPGTVCPGPLVADQSYCVIGSVSTGTATPGPTTTTSTTPTPTKTTPKMTTTTTAQHQPQQSGLASNCNNFYLVQGGDTCSKIEGQYGISNAQFDSWNPSISKSAIASAKLTALFHLLSDSCLHRLGLYEPSIRLLCLRRRAWRDHHSTYQDHPDDVHSWKRHFDPNTYTVRNGVQLQQIRFGPIR